MSTFNGTKYKALLDQLEIADLPLSRVMDGNPVFRYDSEYFSKAALSALAIVNKRNPSTIQILAVQVTDGIHQSIPFVQDGPVRIISAKHPKENFFDLDNCETVDTLFHQANPRTALRVNDVIISTVGTIGNAAVVTADMLPANSDRHVGIIRLSTKLSPYVLSTFLLSRYGKAQTTREVTGNVQPNLFISKLNTLLIPEIPESVSVKIDTIVKKAHSLRKHSLAGLHDADKVLAKALGLEDWQPPSHLTCVRRYSDVRTRERIDAEHYREEFYAATLRLTEAGALRFIPMGELLTTLTNGHTPLRHNLEIGAIPFLCAEHVSNFEVHYGTDKRILAEHHHAELARTALRNHDILITIKGRVGNAAMVQDLPGPTNINQDVALFRLNDKVPGWYLLAFLNSLFGRLQVQQLSTGGINPFLGLSNVRKLQIPEFRTSFMNTIARNTEALVKSARSEREEAHSLLSRATRMIEIAIEQGEKASLAYFATGDD